MALPIDITFKPKLYVALYAIAIVDIIILTSLTSLIIIIAVIFFGQYTLPRISVHKAGHSLANM